MKRSGLALALCSVALGQYSPDAVKLSAPAPPPVTIATAVPVGAGGPATYYYWIVAEYPRGAAFPLNPTIATGAANSLSGGNYVAVSWSAPPTSPTSYDVLRTSTAVLPAGSCTCAVATGLSQLTYNDQGAALSSYTVPTAATGSNASISLDAAHFGAGQLRAAVDGVQYNIAAVQGTPVFSAGAKGDGVTDDRPAIQRALNAAASTCDTVIFPAGYTFLINSVPGSGLILLPPCVSMAGGGTIRLASGLGNFNALFYSSSTLTPASFTGLTIDMNGNGNPITSDPTNVNYHIVFDLYSTGNNLTFNAITFENGNGVWTITTDDDNVAVLNCKWQNWGVNGGSTYFYDTSELYITGNGGIVANNIFYGTGPSAHSAIEVHSNNKVVVGNTIRGFYVGIIYSADQGGTGTARNATITGNTIDGAYVGIDLFATDGNVENLTITGNSVTINRNNTAWWPIQGYESGIYWNDSSSFWTRNLVVANNAIYFQPDQATYVTTGACLSAGIALPANGSLSNAAITNNTIDSPFAAGICIDGGVAMSGVSVSRNTVLNPGQSSYGSLAPDFKVGIFAATNAWTASAIEENIIADNQSTPTMQRGIEIAGLAGSNAPTQLRAVRNQVKYVNPVASPIYYQFETGGPLLDIEGNPGNSTVTFGSFTSGNYPPIGSKIFDPTSGALYTNTNANGLTWVVSYPPAPFASLPAVGPAGSSIYCTNCTVAATCASGGTGHNAVSNGTAWTCQ